MKRLALVVLCVALVSSACAKSSAQGSGSGGTIPPGSRGVRTVTIYPEDSGKTITVVEQQTLVFATSPKEKGPQPWTYRLQSYPPFLTPKSDLAKVPFTFLVNQAGRGNIVVIGQLCSTPLADSLPECPVAGPAGAALRQITITVMAQGRGV